MCCNNVVKELDRIQRTKGENARIALTGFYDLVETCFGNCNQTLTEGLAAEYEEQRKAEEADGRTYHAGFILQMLNRRDDTINKRHEGLKIARQLLDFEKFQEDFSKIENQCR